MLGIFLTEKKRNEKKNRLNQFKPIFTLRDGVYLSIAYLVRKLEGQFREVYASPELLQPAAEEDLEDQQQEASEGSCIPKDDLLALAGNSPTATCLRWDWLAWEGSYSLHVYRLAMLPLANCSKRINIRKNKSWFL